MSGRPSEDSIRPVFTSCSRVLAKTARWRQELSGIIAQPPNRESSTEIRARSHRPDPSAATASGTPCSRAVGQAWPLGTRRHRRDDDAPASLLSRDSPDESQTGINVRVFPALLQDRREVLTATSTSGNPNAWSRV